MRKILIAFLTLAMIMSLAVPAFAEYVGPDLGQNMGSIYVNTDPNRSNNIYMLEGDGKVHTQDVRFDYRVTNNYDKNKTLQENIDAFDAENPAYHVLVDWKESDGALKSVGQYKWDPNAAGGAKYVLVSSGDIDVVNATYELSVKNLSNAPIQYKVEYAAKTVEGAKYSELKQDTFVVNGNTLNAESAVTDASSNWYGIAKATSVLTAITDVVNSESAPSGSASATIQLTAAGRAAFEAVMHDNPENFVVGTFHAHVKLGTPAAE